MKFGTREWAEHNHNILTGCEHGCLYCYARHNAVKRYKYVKSEDDFINHVKLNEKNLNRKPFKYKDGGRIMFPTTHDILPEFIDETVEYLRGWLKVGNEILIVSKPHFDCIKKICDNLSEYKKQVVFRFTIGSKHNTHLKFWEPGAPTFEERLKSLKYAYNKGFQTSISMEPKLDVDVKGVIDELIPYVTDTIWIGNLNFMESRVDKKVWTKDTKLFKGLVEDTQTQHFIETLYDHYKDNPKIKWKESIKKMLGLPDEECG